MKDSRELLDIISPLSPTQALETTPTPPVSSQHGINIAEPLIVFCLLLIHRVYESTYKTLRQMFHKQKKEKWREKKKNKIEIMKEAGS